VVFLDKLTCVMMQSFYAKPIPLDDENSVGDQLAVVALQSQDQDHVFQGIADLIKASGSIQRRRHIFNQ
jgi:hypothetical protein